MWAVVPLENVGENFVEIFPGTQFRAQRASINLLRTSESRLSHVISFYGLLKNLTSMKEIFRSQNSSDIYSPSFSCFATSFLCCNCHRDLVDESGMIRNSPFTYYIFIQRYIV
jgi:hypothetical protein